MAGMGEAPAILQLCVLAHTGPSGEHISAPRVHRGVKTGPARPASTRALCLSRMSPRALPLSVLPAPIPEPLSTHRSITAAPCTLNAHCTNSNFMPNHAGHLLRCCSQVLAAPASSWMRNRLIYTRDCQVQVAS
jgi:hypothetical protein